MVTPQSQNVHKLPQKRISQSSLIRWQHGRPQKLFQGGAKATFCVPCFSGCWRCNAHGRSQNGLLFQHHKENAPCYGNSPKSALRWQQCFFFTRASFHTVQNYVAYSNSSYYLALLPATLPQMSASAATGFSAKITRFTKKFTRS